MVFSFDTNQATNKTKAGGKGSTLARLYQAGYPVPDGFIISADAFNGPSLRPEVWPEVERRLRQLQNGRGPIPVAVRSSAVSEDSAQASFAGEFESVLGLVGDEEIRRAILAVRRSGETDRVHAYSQAQGIDGRHRLAVLVQRIVPAEMAGVLFTADPVSGSQNHMSGNFVYGLGEKLVAGEAMPQTFTLARPKGSYTGPPALQRYGRQLFKLGRQLEAELEGPQDIEWALAGGRLYLLQARPITTMQPYNPATGEWNDSRRGHYLWTNANFGEAVPDVMTPMTWSMLQIYGRETFTIPLPDAHPLFGNIGGRLYLNASLAASMMKAIGFNDARVQAQTREFFGYLPPATEIPLIPFSRWAVIKAFLKAAPAAMRRVRRQRKQLAAFTTTVPAQAAGFQQQIARAQTTAELLALWQQLLPLFRQACQMLQAGTGLFEDLVRPLRRDLTRWVGENDANTLLSGFSQQGDPLASLGPILGLWQVAQGQISREDYTRQYGHRGPHEFELSRPRPAEEPDWIRQQTAHLQDIDVPTLLARQETGRQAAWAHLRRSQPRRRSKAAARLAEVAAAARGREAIRSEVVRLVAVLRAFALRAGALSGLGDGVFFLRLEELAELLAGEATAVAHVPARRQAHARFTALPPYPGLIIGRFDPHQWAADPNRRLDIYDPNAAISTTPAGQTLAGFPGAAGEVEGYVRRLDTVEEGTQLQPGEILVTATTNVGWTPLFAKAAAIITDVGAPLSHAAIVARELGIPAVVGTGNATMRLQTGDRVRLDGRRGVIEILTPVTAAT